MFLFCVFTPFNNLIVTLYPPGAGLIVIFLFSWGSESRTGTLPGASERNGSSRCVSWAARAGGALCAHKGAMWGGGDRDINRADPETMSSCPEYCLFESSKLNVKYTPTKQIRCSSRFTRFYVVVLCDGLNVKKQHGLLTAEHLHLYTGAPGTV